jgi:SAM-dependent methyltransferase
MTAVSAARLALVLLFAASAALAQTKDAPFPPYEPSSGQDGKDVVWVPTPDALVEKMLDLGKVTAKDTVIDLGSGDGRTVIAAAKRGARALGIEYNPDLVEYSRRRAAAAGVKAEFVKADLFKSDFSKATVITMFLLTDINLKLRPKLLALRPGTRIVSNTFKMGEWDPDDTATLGGEACKSSYCTAYLWIIPARAAGVHKLPQGELRLQQDFQKLSGFLHADGKSYAVKGKVTGEEVAFSAGGRQYRGRMKGTRLELQG